MQQIRRGYAAQHFDLDTTDDNTQPINQYWCKIVDRLLLARVGVSRKASIASWIFGELSLSKRAKDRARASRKCKAVASRSSARTNANSRSPRLISWRPKRVLRRRWCKQEKSRPSKHVETRLFASARIHYSRRARTVGLHPLDELPQPLARIKSIIGLQRCVCMMPSMRLIQVGSEPGSGADKRDANILHPHLSDARFGLAQCGMASPVAAVAVVAAKGEILL